MIEMKSLRPKEENIKCYLILGSVGARGRASKLQIFAHVNSVSALSLYCAHCKKDS